MFCFFFWIRWPLFRTLAEFKLKCIKFCCLFWFDTLTHTLNSESGYICRPYLQNSGRIRNKFDWVYRFFRYIPDFDSKKSGDRTIVDDLREAVMIGCTICVFHMHFTGYFVLRKANRNEERPIGKTRNAAVLLGGYNINI